MDGLRFALNAHVRLYVSALSVALIGGGLLFYLDPVSAKPWCPPGQFRDSTAVPARCSPCSSCPINHIVRKPCGRQNDTVCGPFYEFEFFNQPRNGTMKLLGERPYFSKHGYRLAYDSNAQSDDKYLVAMTTTSISPDEAFTVRCGQPQWRMWCYGLVALLIVVVSVALTAFALFTYCRTSVKTIRLDEIPGVTRGSETDDGLSASSTIIVSRDVRHLEEQLIHNQRRKAFLRWLFGSPAAADRLFSSNDYLDERYRRRFIRILNGSGGRRGEVLPLEPYPGMTLTGRTDSRHPIQPDASEEEMTLYDGSVGQMDRQTTPSGVDEVQAEEHSATGEERSLLISQESRLQTGTG